MEVDWNYVNLEQFRKGIEVELEHGSKFIGTNLIADELHLSAIIALAHLKESYQYYTRLAKMEEEMEENNEGVRKIFKYEK